MFILGYQNLFHEYNNRNSTLFDQNNRNSTLAQFQKVNILNSQQFLKKIHKNK